MSLSALYLSTLSRKIYCSLHGNYYLYNQAHYKKGIYIKFDENQRLLYNCISRETFTDYFQLDTAGKLKSIKSVGDIGEVKPNSDTVKLELSDICASLSEVEKQCQFSSGSIIAEII